MKKRLTKLLWCSYQTTIEGYKSRPLVRAELSSINKKEELELIIDTGAEKTCLSDDHIRDLELVQAGEPKKVKGNHLNAI
jgi:hypothetical protein